MIHPAHLRALLLSAPLALAALPAGAAVITLDFEGIGDQAEVGDYYYDAYGVRFSTGSLAIVDQDAGGGGNFANEPSPDTILFFLSTGSATLNAENGFTTGFSFYYATHSFPGTVTVYSGLDKTGSVLATLDLPALGFGTGDPNGGDYGIWAPIGVTFAGTAYSIDFAGTANFIGFDNITFGSEIPTPPVPAVPLPAAAPLALAGLGLLGALRLRRRG